MTCIAWNPATDPFMFATGCHDGSVQIWTTPGMLPGNSNSRSARTEVQPVDPSVVSLAVPEPGRRYIPMREENSTDSTLLVPPREMLTVSSEPLNALTARRHSWV
jgi:WD40 repeat protein